MVPAGTGRADVAVIGAGVVGLAIAYRLSKAGMRVIVVERKAEAGMGVTAGQAGVLHVVQLPFGSLKSKLAKRGNRMYDGLCAELGVKLDRMPALLVVAGWSKLPVLFASYVYLKLGLRGEFRIRLMRGKSLGAVEPQMADTITAGIVVDGYGSIDAAQLVSGLKAAAERLGTDFQFDTEFMDAEVGREETLLKTNRGDVGATFVVNAAGLYSDDVARILGSDLGRHEPGLGVMAVYSGLGVRSIVAPLPISVGSRTKGGAIVPAVDGTTIMGPTLRLAESKEDRGYTDDDLTALRRKFGPLLKSEGRLLRVYTGMRPLSPTRDFVIDFDRRRRVVNLVGIESPGLTAAPAIAEMVERMIMGVPA